MATIAPSPSCVNAARLSAMVAGLDAELCQAIASANITRKDVIAARDTCRESYAEYAASSQKLSTVKAMHWKLAVRAVPRAMITAQ